MKNKWILLGVAIVLMAINLLDGDFTVYQQLSPTDLVPVIAIVIVIFLIKAGVLSALLIGVKRLWEWLRHK